MKSFGLNCLGVLLLVAGCAGPTGGAGGGGVQTLPDISSNFGGASGGGASGGGGTADTGPSTSPTDTSGAADAGSGSQDAGGVQDTGAPDSAAPDTGAPDGAVFDSGAPDAGAPDTGSPDTGTPDAGTFDAGGQDTGPAPCGDGTCSANESCQTCPADCGFCPKSCGDKTCDDDENCKNCPGDCGACPAGCGDGTCNPQTENCQTCSLDCGKCPALCGDKSCNGNETCSSCPADCGACPGTCGDGKCDATKEDCKSCSADCGACPGVCDPLTSSGCSAAQMCYPTSTSAACGNPGTKQEGAACSLTTDCAKGMLCVGKACKKLCDTSGKNAQYACSGGGKCDALQYGDGKPVGYNLGSCTVYNKCTLTTDAGCAASQTCDFVKEGKICLPHGTKTEGLGCKGLDECAKGYMCIGNPTVCKKKCKTGGGFPSCSGGKQCLVVTTDNNGTPAPDKLGVCN